MTPLETASLIVKVTVSMQLMRLSRGVADVEQLESISRV
jgi:hypothetical protein